MECLLFINIKMSSLTISFNIVLEDLYWGQGREHAFLYPPHTEYSAISWCPWVGRRPSSSSPWFGDGKWPSGRWQMGKIWLLDLIPEQSCCFTLVVALSQPQLTCVYKSFLPICVLVCHKVLCIIFWVKHIWCLPYCQQPRENTEKHRETINHRPRATVELPSSSAVGWTSS